MKYLVEEHEFEMGYGPETITRHELVEADSFVDAMYKAAFGRDFYQPEELEEWVPGYCWAAADGSSVCVEVRLVEGG
jgi:hypothetical protein